jgi:hypothetical protein
MVIVEVKGDHQINSPVVQAKREFAEQMAIRSGMTYEMIKGTNASAQLQTIIELIMLPFENCTVGAARWFRVITDRCCAAVRR